MARDDITYWRCSECYGQGAPFCAARPPCAPNATGPAMRLSMAPRASTNANWTRSTAKLAASQHGHRDVPPVQFGSKLSLEGEER